MPPEWSGNAELTSHLPRISEAASLALAGEDRVRFASLTLLHAERILSVARGLHFCTAIEAALKIAETTYTPTQSFSSADLLHGPIASVAVRTPCLMFLPNGKTIAMMEEVAEKLEARGARGDSLYAQRDRRKRPAID